jgi:tellurite resistance protein
VTLLVLFAALAYLAKLARRAGTLGEDLRVLPGLGGVAAAILCVYMLALTIMPYRPEWSDGLILAGFALHAALILAVGVSLASGPPERRRVAPVWHLVFVGPVIGALAAARLGWSGTAFWVAAGAGVAALAIWGASLAQALRERVPVPLRPLLLVHLAPVALLGMVAEALDYRMAGHVAALVAALMIAVYLVLAVWITEGGFSPMWGAMTFPLAATASLWIAMGGVWEMPGAFLFIFCAIFVPVVAIRILKLWANGRLSAITNAAVA